MILWTPLQVKYRDYIRNHSFEYWILSTWHASNHQQCEIVLVFLCGSSHLRDRVLWNNALADLGEAQGRLPPFGQNFFIFMQFFFGKINQIVGWALLEVIPSPLWEIPNPPLQCPTCHLSPELLYKNKFGGTLVPFMGSLIGSEL